VELALRELDLKVARPLEDILPIIHVGIEETHRIQMNLRPALLDSLGILATISWFTREFQKANPEIEVRAQLDVKEEQLPNPIKSVIYRIIQEAFNNVARHSGAHHVDLVLQRERNQLRLVIQDDGKGFDLDAAYALHDADRGLGLAGMKERAVLAGGSMSIESTHGQGATISALWPLS
jgi:signal transduction histidine kinase